MHLSNQLISIGVSHTCVSCIMHAIYALCILIFISCLDVRKRYHPFIIDIVCENPYRFIAYGAVYFIGNWNIVIGILYTIALVLVDQDVESICAFNVKHK